MDERSDGLTMFDSSEKMSGKAANRVAAPKALRLTTSTPAGSTTWSHKYGSKADLLSGRRQSRLDSQPPPFENSHGGLQKQLRRATQSDGDFLDSLGARDSKSRARSTRAAAVAKQSRKGSKHHVGDQSRSRTERRLSAGSSRHSRSTGSMYRSSNSRRISNVNAGERKAATVDDPHDIDPVLLLQPAGKTHGTMSSGNASCMLKFIAQSQREYARKDSSLCLRLGDRSKQPELDGHRDTAGKAPRHARIVPITSSSDSRSTSFDKPDTEEECWEVAPPSTFKLRFDLVQATEWRRAKHESEQFEAGRKQVRQSELSFARCI